MSRVEEAMQRAAVAAQGISSSAAGQSHGIDDHEIDRLAREPLAADEAGTHSADTANVRLTAPAAKPHAVNADDEQGRMFNRANGVLAEKLVVDPRMAPGSREQYRRLAAVLHDSQAVTAMKVIMIASAAAGEGKTLTAVNLALTLSGSYRKRVLLMDADLRRPTVHQLFRIDTSHGLADGLDVTREARLVVRQMSPTLAILPAGRPTMDPMAALIGDRMKQLVGEARETFDWVIIDTPPLVLLPDANLLASMVDGAVLVIRAGSTPHELTKRAVEAIGRSRIVGVVLNRATQTIGEPAVYYDYYTEAQSGSATT